MKRKTHPVVEQIEDEVRRVLDRLGYELLLITYSTGGGRPRLTVYIDKPGGVNIGDCQRASEQLSVLLDMLDPIARSYDLIVSSPGLNRPIVRDEDFVRFQGRLARVKRVAEDGSAQVVEGRIEQVRDGKVFLRDEKGHSQQVPLDEIEQANLVYEWEDEG